jgi:hypothetical protein
MAIIDVDTADSYGDLAFYHAVETRNFPSVWTDEEQDICEDCGRSWAELEAAWNRFRSVSGLSEAPLMHRCRYAIDPDDDICELHADDGDGIWQAFCHTPHPIHNARQSNGEHCHRCDLTLQSCRFHRWATVETHLCRPCAVMCRSSLVFELTIRRTLEQERGPGEELLGRLAFSGEAFGVFSIKDRHRDTETLATELRRWIEFMHLEALRNKDGPARLCLDGNLRDWARFRVYTEAQFMRSNVEEAWILAGWRTFNFTVTGVDQEGTVIGVFPDYRICEASRCLAGRLAPSPTIACR